eukprot:UN06673
MATSNRKRNITDIANERYPSNISYPKRKRHKQNAMIKNNNPSLIIPTEAQTVFINRHNQFIQDFTKLPPITVYPKRSKQVTPPKPIRMKQIQTVPICPPIPAPSIQAAKNKYKGNAFADSDCDDDDMYCNNTIVMPQQQCYKLHANDEMNVFSDPLPMGQQYYNEMNAFSNPFPEIPPCFDEMNAFSDPIAMEQQCYNEIYGDYTASTTDSFSSY